MLAWVKHLQDRHREREEELAAIARAAQSLRRSGDEPEKTMTETVFETAAKYPDGGPV
jgi:hypothetical protein